MGTHRFETELQAEGSGVFFEVPLDVPAVFGKARAPVRGTINGHPFRSTVAVYGGRPYLPVNKALRGAAGVAAGDAVVIELEADQPRTVDPPPDLAAALDAYPEARAAFDGLSFTHQREYAEWVAEARGGGAARADLPAAVGRALAPAARGRPPPLPATRSGLEHPPAVGLGPLGEGRD